MGAYATFDAAAKRVATLRHYGRWPGIIGHHDGTYSLTWDPGWAVSRI